MRKSLHGELLGSRPCHSGGKAEVLWEETGTCTRGDAGVGDQASKEGLTEIKSGRASIQQGLVRICKDSLAEAKAGGSERMRVWRMSP